MARFADLARSILSKVAQELVRSRYPNHPNPLDLLPLQQIHPRFAPHIMCSVLQTSKIKADGSVRPVWAQRDDWSQASRFLFVIRREERCSYVRNLTFTLEGSEGAWLGTRKHKMNQCIQLLTAVGPHIRNLHLQGDTFGEGPWEWQPEISDIAFPRLQNLELGSYYLPLLSNIMNNSPQLRTLSLGNDPRWADRTYRACPTYPSECHNIPPLPKLELLSINHASNYGILLFLAGTRVRARHVHLTVSVWEPSGLSTLAEGIRAWPMFDDVQQITLIADFPTNRRLSVVAQALAERKIPFLVQQETLQIPLLDDER